MKIIKQLSEDEFVIKMGEEDLVKDRRIKVAHDYVEIFGRNWYCNDFQVEGKYGFGNVLDVATSVQIPIRIAQDMLKTISTYKYLQPEHLVRENGEPAYLYPDSGNQMYRYRTESGEEMVAIMDDKGEFHHMTAGLYSQIKKS